MFTITAFVRIDLALSKHSIWNYSFEIYFQEAIIFYSKFAEEIYDLKGFDRDFNLTLPFRDADLTIDSPVSLVHPQNWWTFFNRLICCTKQEYRKITKEIRDSYFGDAAIDENSLKQYINLLSDINFGYGISKAAKRHATKSNSKTYYLR